MTRLFLTNFEYVALRLVRRFLLPSQLRRLGRLLPYYKENVSETDPESMLRLYRSWLGRNGYSAKGRRIVELGSGLTNAAGYALASEGAAQVWCVEPYAALDPELDETLLARLALAKGTSGAEIAAKVTRCASLKEVGLGGVDLILSHSVLEHVREFEVLCEAMRSVLACDGRMLHIVDYRDHFFKYPLHFLQFSSQTWDRFLDPGDLPRWRLGDHLRELRRQGFGVDVIHRDVAKTDDIELVRDSVSSDFDPSDADFWVLRAALYCSPVGQRCPPPADRGGRATGVHPTWTGAWLAPPGPESTGQPIMSTHHDVPDNKAI